MACAVAWLRSSSRTTDENDGGSSQCARYSTTSMALAVGGEAAARILTPPVGVSRVRFVLSRTYLEYSRRAIDDVRAVVLRNGQLTVRETPDPVPGAWRVAAADAQHRDLRLGRPLHGSPGARDRRPDRRSLYDADRDIVLGPRVRRRGRRPRPGLHRPVPGRHPGHVDADPAASTAGSAATRIIGQHPEAQGSFGELLVVRRDDGQGGRRRRARAMPSPLVDAFAVGEFYVRSSPTSQPGEIPIVIGAGAIGLSAVAALAEPRRRADRRLGLQGRAARAGASGFGAHVLVDPAERSPFDVWQRVARRAPSCPAPAVVFECVGAAGLIQQLVDVGRDGHPDLRRRRLVHRRHARHHRPRPARA